MAVIAQNRCRAAHRRAYCPAFWCRPSMFCVTTARQMALAAPSRASTRCVTFGSTAERKHFFTVEPVKILRVSQKKAVTDDRFGRVVEFLVVQAVHAAEIGDAGLSVLTRRRRRKTPCCLLSGDPAAQLAIGTVRLHPPISAIRIYVLSALLYGARSWRHTGRAGSSRVRRMACFLRQRVDLCVVAGEQHLRHASGRAIPRAG